VLAGRGGGELRGGTAQHLKRAAAGERNDQAVACRPAR